MSPTAAWLAVVGSLRVSLDVCPVDSFSCLKVRSHDCVDEANRHRIARRPASSRGRSRRLNRPGEGRTRGSIRQIEKRAIEKLQVEVMLRGIEPGTCCRHVPDISMAVRKIHRR